MRMIENGDAFNDRYANDSRYHFNSLSMLTAFYTQFHTIKKTTIALIKHMLISDVSEIILKVYYE